MKPNSANHDPSPDYLRTLISQVEDETLFHEGKPSQTKIAKRLGIPPRTFRDYLSKGNAKYTVQYALEMLATTKS